ncbi:Cu/Zn superoxide dismutase [Melampsora larici-populina 98AG31]|uniref:superoxide dismutase n=1 Tax=Melampsora larici-populina (strain 98AG31 / pathotype 3-4-7) TaxID=747676 RepID=F4S8S3_MELLP|nr:Cu/Zn superoxide dismutase [Melampsora larici-populina 98AG31]EGF98975.1 Cu/Zn superoxide dismutase [Melampsora larici-populina 98AG31]
MISEIFVALIAASSSHLAVADGVKTATTATLTASTAASTPAPGLAVAVNNTNSLTASCLLAGSFGVSGNIRFTLGNSSEEVDVKVSVNGLMAINSTAQFAYHIHTNPISADGNCSSALGHLDPLQVTDGLTCDPLMPQYCQEGDLAGRHGKLPGNVSTADVDYSDNFIRFWPQPFSILGRSIVIHAPNSTRLACGNITSFVDGTADENGNPTGKPSNYTTDYPTKASPPGAKVSPFIGTMTDTAALATITLPVALPDVGSEPNIVFTSSVVTRTINATVTTLTLPAAAPAATPFNYTAGATLPSQSVLLTINGTTNSSTTPGKGAASSASQFILNPISLLIPLFIVLIV